MNQVELISAIQHGNDAAWQTLVNEHQQAIFRWCYLMLHDSDDADDATQETLIRAFRALHTFDSERPLRPWLLQIASNVTRNRQRSLRRYLAALQRSFSQSETSTNDSSERTAAQWEADQLWQAIRRLKHDDQAVLYLRYFLEQTEREMSQTLNIAVGTVKSRLHRATARLRTVIEREFPALHEERYA